MSKKHVLLVDDEETITFSLGGSLKNKKFEVFITDNLHDAKRLLERSDIDVVLTDLEYFEKKNHHLNSNAGNELAKLANKKQIPVIGLSASHKKFKKDLFVETFEKPFDLHDVIKATLEAVK